tara:strand:+ start:166 stop:555 length:390 start_codon:yes stop_codon:yes gene_type:complete
MTKKEITGIRDLTFSRWVRAKLPDSSTGYCVSDLDFILWNWKSKKVIMIELKQRGGYPENFQSKMWSNINKWIKKGIDNEWKYLGFHLIQFENTEFINGKCYLNRKEISEKNLIDFLSLDLDSKIYIKN